MPTRAAQGLFRLIWLLACLAQTACLGVTTPEIQEFWASPLDARSKMQAIVAQVRCELGDALWKARHKLDSTIDHRLDFLDTWGVQVVFTFSVDEKSAFSPGASVISPLPTLTTRTVSGPVTSAQNFTGSFGGVYSSEGISIDKTTLFYPVKGLTAFGAEPAPCRDDDQRGTLFVNSDLGIHDWLYRNLAIQAYRNSDLTLGDVDNVLSHDVKFEVVTSGNGTPTWKLVRFTGSTTNPLFFVSRDRFEQVLITMGRANKVGGGLDTTASYSSLASQINAAIRSPDR